MNRLFFSVLFLALTIASAVPTWADAMSHCDGKTKAEWIRKLKKRGIRVELPAEAAEEQL